MPSSPRKESPLSLLSLYWKEDPRSAPTVQSEEERTLYPTIQPLQVNKDLWHKAIMQGPKITQ